MMKTVEKSTSKPCNNPFLGFIAFAKSIDSKLNNGLSISCYPSSIFGYSCQHLDTPTTLKRTLLTQAQIKTLIKHCVDVSVAMSITPVHEISSIKYAKASGIPHKRVKEWCIKDVLTCRRLDNDGHEIADWKQNPKLGHGYINTSKQIGEY
jgi:hypothetical protein